MTPTDRRILFHRGFGDGAKCSAIKFPSQPDYMAGWEAGKKACEEACERYRAENGLPPPLILRAQKEKP